jgi:hypothetical protein
VRVRGPYTRGQHTGRSPAQAAAHRHRSLRLPLRRNGGVKKGSKRNLGFVPFHFRGAAHRTPERSLTSVPAASPSLSTSSRSSSSASGSGSLGESASGRAGGGCPPAAAPRQGKAAPFRSQLAQYEPKVGCQSGSSCSTS